MNLLRGGIPQAGILLGGSERNREWTYRLTVDTSGRSVPVADDDLVPRTAVVSGVGRSLEGLPIGDTGNYRIYKEGARRDQRKSAERSAQAEIGGARRDQRKSAERSAQNQRLSAGPCG
jgi:hypothetical protein